MKKKYLIRTLETLDIFKEKKSLRFPLPSEDYFSKEAAEYKGRKVKLNEPMRSSGPKKYKVYVKDPKSGNIRKINFEIKKVV